MQNTDDIRKYFERKTIKHYNFYNEARPDKKVAVITIIESALNKEGSIEIIDENEAPVLLKLGQKYSNNYKGAIACLETRAMQPNRMGLAEYCEKNNLDVNSLDDRISISKGMNYDDECFIVLERTVEDV